MTRVFLFCFIATVMAISAPGVFIIGKAQSAAVLSEAQRSRRGDTSRTISVGANVDASAENSRTFHGEVQMVADPGDPNHLLACSMMGLNSDATTSPRTVVAYVSFDRGKSWAMTFKMPGYQGEPACALGRGGHAYVSSLGGGPPNEESVMIGFKSYIYRSTDGGRHWTESAPFTNVLGNLDRQYFSVDDVSSVHSGRVYFSIYDYLFGPAAPFSGYLKVMHSDDGGKTFSKPVIADPKRDGMQAGPSTILADGTLIVESSRLEDERVAVSVSRDGGNTFRTYTVMSKSGGLGLNPIAADTTTGPFHNRIYIVFERTGRHIGLVHSDDRGATWSPPTTVDDVELEQPNAKYLIGRPWVAVNKNGLVGVVWTDHRGLSDPNGLWIRFAVSRDGGLTFSPSVKISANPNQLEPRSLVQLDDQTYGGGKKSQDYYNYPPGFRAYKQGVPITGGIGVDSRYAVSAGDVIALAADAGGDFHAGWAGNSTGVSQIMTAPIHVEGGALRNGDASLASYNDVTMHTELHFYHPTFNRATGIASVDAALSNTSGRPIMGPIALRLTALRSAIGTPFVIGADNGESRLGAIWDFSPAGSTTLSPGARTAVRTLRFRLANARRPSQLGGDVADELQIPMASYVTIEAHAYAR